jgi:hypothetical protein
VCEWFALVDETWELHLEIGCGADEEKDDELERGEIEESCLWRISWEREDGGGYTIADVFFCWGVDCEV